MTQVFLSYSRRDLGFVERLVSDLKEAGLDVWYDLSGLDGGSRWRKAIEEAIRESQYVVIVLSPDSVNSEWVEREYLFANNLGKKIVPVLYRQCDLPIYYLNIHFIDVQEGNYKRNLDLLLRVLSGEAVKSREFSKPVTAGVGKPSGRRSLLSVGLIGALIVAILLGASYLSKLFSPTPTTLSPNMTDTFIPSPVPDTSTPTESPTPTEMPFPPEIVDAKGVEMVFVPEGPFLMGNKNSDDRDEQDEHTVILSAYYIDKYEVTNALYKDCVNAGVCDPPVNIGSYSFGDYYHNPNYKNHPVIYVTWTMADEYCQWRGDGTRLPTEAEWEKAAKGEMNYSYPWGDAINCEYANFRYSGEYCSPDPSHPDPARVGSYEIGKSPYGVYDMAGNVWEWVGDWYSPVYYVESIDMDPPGPSVAYLGNKEKVLRGGSWKNNQSILRITNRNYFGNFGWDNDIGFRCARSLNP